MSFATPVKKDIKLSTPVASMKQEPKTITPAESSENLPIAEFGQLQWVKRRLASLSMLASENGNGDEEPHDLWWPSLLFSDYEGFQDFFQEEFHENLETVGLMQFRMFENMREQRTIMPARLLGRSVGEYVEIVCNPDVEDPLEDHQAADFIAFTRMPQEVHQRQSLAEAFTVECSNKTENEEVTKVIDDELYMNYMLALDLAATERMAGRFHSNKTLKSHFRDLGRERLKELPTSVQRISEQESVTPSSSLEFHKEASELNEDEVESKEERDGDSSSDSDDEIENNNKSEEAHALQNSATGKSHSLVSAQQKGNDQFEKLNDAVEIPGTQAGEATNPSSATVISHSSETTNVRTQRTSSSPTIDSETTDSSIDAMRTEEESETKSPTASPTTPERSKLGHGLSSPTRKEGGVAVSNPMPSSPSAPLVPSPRKKKRRGRGPKNIAHTRKKQDVSKSPSRDSSQKKMIGFLEECSKQHPSPLRLREKIDRKRTPKKDRMRTPKMKNTRDATKASPAPAALLFTPQRQIASDSFENNKNDENMTVDNTQGVDTNVVKENSPAFPVNTHTVQLSKTPSQPTDIDDPGISSEDNFEQVLEKLEYAGWNFDLHEGTYFSPSVGFDDIKIHPNWRDKKYFLGKGSFLVYLRDTYGWIRKKTPSKRLGKKRSNAVTPTFSNRPKRHCRSPTFCGRDLYETPTPRKERKKFQFPSEEKEDFYHFKNLMLGLQKVCGWQYIPAKTHDWQYVLPGRPKEGRGGKYLEDFFYEESEVIEYCMSNNYYEKRLELGL